MPSLIGHPASVDVKQHESQKDVDLDLSGVTKVSAKVTCVTKSGRVWRKVPESDARSVHML